MSTNGSEQTTGTSSAATAPPTKRQKTSSSSSSSSTAVAPIFSTTRNINKVPVEVWKEHICYKFLNLTELSILRRCHTFFEKYWQNVMAQNVIRVPQGCPTVEKAMPSLIIECRNLSEIFYHTAVCFLPQAAAAQYHSRYSLPGSIIYRSNFLLFKI
jgi:hypothetical protein